jgi:hypothetical protein
MLLFLLRFGRFSIRNGNLDAATSSAHSTGFVLAMPQSNYRFQGTCGPAAARVFSAQ